LASQNCSFRITKPMPGSSITVLGGGAALTGVPITTTPTSPVSSSLEDAPDASAALLDWDLTRVALMVHPFAVGRRQTPVAAAKLEAVLAGGPRAPVLSLAEASALTAEPMVTASRL
jgi:hypothetical protein